MLDRFYILDPWFAYGLSAVIVLAAAEFGRWIGVIWRRHHPEDVSPDILTLEGATLGLLALMIGFSFSIALNRFDARQSGVADEANAIGTSALYARMLPEPHASEVKGLLHDYVQLRVDLFRAPPSPISLEQMIRRSNQLQAELARHAIEVSAIDPHSISAGLFMHALNEMFDLQEKRIAAARNRVPGLVFMLLYGIAVVAIGFSGYASALGSRRGRIPVAIMAVLVSGVIAMVGDIDGSQTGFINVSQQAMHDLAQSMDR